MDFLSTSYACTFEPKAVITECNMKMYGVPFRLDIPIVLYRIININNIWSNTTQLMILLRCISYIVSFRDMFWLEL